jgi:hypothetical protein
VIIAGVANQNVRTGGARQVFDIQQGIALTGAPGGEVGGDRNPKDGKVGAVAAIDGIGARSTINQVCAGVPVEVVRTSVTADLVTAGRAEDGVVSPEAADDVRVGRSVQDIAPAGADDRTGEPHARLCRGIGHGTQGCDESQTEEDAEVGWVFHVLYSFGRGR